VYATGAPFSSRLFGSLGSAADVSRATIAHLRETPDPTVSDLKRELADFGYQRESHQRLRASAI
jgi:hypothetical protein